MCVLSGTPSWRGINRIEVASLWSVLEGLAYLAREDELPGFMKMVGFVDKKNCRFEYSPSHPTNLPISKGEYFLVVYRTNKFFVYFRF
ncbi:hypothetical protein ACM5PK_005064, partial [Escherichia coli]